MSRRVGARTGDWVDGGRDAPIRRPGRAAAARRGPKPGRAAPDTPSRQAAGDTGRDADAAAEEIDSLARRLGPEGAPLPPPRAPGPGRGDFTRRSDDAVAAAREARERAE